MSHANTVLKLVQQKPGLTELEISKHLFGKEGVQQRVNYICRRLVKEQKIERRGAGYQSDPYAYYPLQKSFVTPEIIASKLESKPASLSAAKPVLTKSYLLTCGFKMCATWRLSSGEVIEFDCRLPTERGVYAFCKGDVVQYIGVAAKGIAKRLYFYTRPGPRQITNIRINAIIKSELAQGRKLEILAAMPSNFDWNGLPVDGVMGLEAGLINRYSLPWNVRGA
ncbi:GIY-YIG nuclease family protein [Tsuneonella sp. CC-YZS046]|uniref:GIY-YIG nuclease family protein n=1 Tax=Tsuneonella sp. CC-YZS046 TaxID=3042152 RepID=UPI002D78B110|nr:GIY-YIG nuclease family protein [Tsuneonella sp. CC-YZS046]WRO67573.1 GIY-YIG nuclease family protein [Tsuneonella sp. CC-YZS046]